MLFRIVIEQVLAHVFPAIPELDVVEEDKLKMKNTCGRSSLQDDEWIAMQL